MAPNISGAFATSPIGGANLATGAAAANLGFTLNPPNNRTDQSGLRRHIHDDDRRAGGRAALGARGLVTSPIENANLPSGGRRRMSVSRH